MNSRERIGNRSKRVEGGQRRWVKRGDGSARMETAGDERRRESEKRGGPREKDRAKNEVSAGADERTLTSYYLLIANSFSPVAY